ncbi:MAG: hypothetical protein KAQ89_05530 [Planctomycetes bacterium]|nr:hypothetical protein [Planctomycetota bacterium]
MFGKINKSKLLLKTRMFNVQWYPSDKGCVSTIGRKIKHQQMPPLMVRKPQWRS